MSKFQLIAEPPMQMNGHFTIYHQDFPSCLIGVIDQQVATIAAYTAHIRVATPGNEIKSFHLKGNDGALSHFVLYIDVKLEEYKTVPDFTVLLDECWTAFEEFLSILKLETISEYN